MRAYIMGFYFTYSAIQVTWADYYLKGEELQKTMTVNALYDEAMISA